MRVYGGALVYRESGLNPGQVRYPPGMETLPLSEVKAHLSELIERVVGQQERILVTRNGRPGAVLISPDDLESLEETLAVMSNPLLMESVTGVDEDDDDDLPLAEVIDAMSSGSRAVRDLDRTKARKQRAKSR